MNLKVALTIMLAALVIAAAIMLVTEFSAAGTAAAAQDVADRGYIDWEMRGFTYSSWWDDEYLRAASDQTLDRIRGTGANWVSLNITQYMDYADSTEIYQWQGGRTASDAALIEAINDAHARGMKVMLKPHVDVRYGDVWRGDIRPADTAAWFDSYRRFIDHYALIAEQNGVELFAVGSELASMSGRENYSEWELTVAGVKNLYHGELTYSASLNEYGYACIWQWMDYLGFNFYFPLSESQDPSVEELMRGWHDYNGRYTPANWLERIRSWQAYWNKPVIFTEIGYRSILGTAISPWDFWTPGIYSGQAQARAYEAAFRVLAGEPYVIGAFWWNWTVGDIHQNPQNTEYSVAGKPAEAVVTNWYTNRTSSTPRLQMDLCAVVWESYDNYRDRRLSVFFDVGNPGGEAARGVNVMVAGASNGVLAASPAESFLGDIGPGETMQVKVVYLVPEGTTSFRVNNYASFRDASGSTFYFPVAPPGY